MNLLDKARQQREILVKACINLDDKDSSVVPEFFNSLTYDGSLIVVGTKINWNGTVKKAAVDLWNTEENNPENAPSLWQDLAYKNGIRIIPETITTTTMFSKDELGWWQDELYKSLIDNNIWTPDAYSGGWEKIDK